MERFTRGIKVSGRAITYFGSQSISNDTSAMFELIKNSRDADANRVSISFENMESDHARIVIEDNGTGMTYDDILDKWLVAGTDSKSRNTKSPTGRTVWGEMGIGRFACEKLAKRVTLESYPSGCKEMIQMSFDWDLYKQPGITFDSVEHPGYVDDKDDQSKQGLKLVLEDLNMTWTVGKIATMTKDLGAFILPSALKGPDDIDITINAKQYGIQDAQVKGAVTKVAPLKMIASLSDENLSIRISNVEHNKGEWTDCDPIEPIGDLACGPFTFNLYFYPRDTAKKTDGKWESYYDKFDGLDIGEFLNEHSGVYLYRDGAWMKPLGGKNDWLHLEARRVQRGTRLGSSQVYGIIRISHDTNPGIMHTAHRETIQDNEAFRDLKKAILKSIAVFEKYRENAKRENKSDKPSGVGDETLAKNNIRSLVKTLRENRDRLPEGAYVKIKNDVSATGRYIEAIVREKDTDVSKFGELRHHEDTLAAIGLLTSYMAHEITKPLNDNIRMLANASKVTGSACGPKTLVGDVSPLPTLENLQENNEQILHFVEFVHTLSKHITTSVRRGGKPMQFRVSDAFDTVAMGLGDFTSGLGIDVKSDVDESLEINFNLIDLDAILTNLFLNSISILKKNEDGGRQIHFKTAYLQDGLVIEFSDNGRGVAREHLEKIFEPFYTVTENPNEAAHGNGLGLAIVEKLVDRHGGKVAAASPSPYFHNCGITITVRFPADRVPKVGTR